MLAPSGSHRDGLVLLVVSVLVLAAVLGSGLAAADASSASDPAVGDQLERTGLGDTTGVRSQAAITDHRGDVLRIPLNVSSYGGASVSITGDDSDYSASLSVSDGDGDGTVTIRFNTHLPGIKRTYTAVDPEDSVSYYSQRRVDGLLPAGDYTVSVAPSDGADYTRALTVLPRSTGDVSLLVAPDGVGGSLDSIEAVRRARQRGRLTPLDGGDGDPPRLATEDLLVVRLNASGFSGVLERQSGDTLTERFVDFAEGRPVDLVFEEQDPDATPAPGTVLWDATNTRVIADEAGDTYYVVVDTNGLRVSRDPDSDEDRGPVAPGMVLQTNFTVRGGTAFAESSETVTAGRLAVAERSAAAGPGLREANRSYLSPAADQPVALRTTLAPGSRVTVTLSSDAPDVDRTRTATVGPNGTVAPTFDLSGVPRGTELEVVVRDGADRRLGATTARVVAPHAAVTVEGQTLDNGTLEVTVTADLSRGGLVAIRTPGGSVLGTKVVEPGNRTVAVDVDDVPVGGARLSAVAYRDMDGDGALSTGADRPYERDGEPVADSTTVDVTPTPDPPTTGGPDTSTPTADTPTAGTPGGTPGTATPSPVGPPVGTPDPFPELPPIPGSEFVPALPGVRRRTEVAVAAGTAVLGVVGLLGVLRG